MAVFFAAAIVARNSQTLTGMLVARASAAPKNPGHAGLAIYWSQYLISSHDRGRSSYFALGGVK